MNSNNEPAENMFINKPDSFKKFMEDSVSAYRNNYLNELKSINTALHSVINSELNSIILKDDWSNLTEQWVANWSDGSASGLISKYRKIIRNYRNWANYLSNYSHRKSMFDNSSCDDEKKSDEMDKLVNEIKTQTDLLVSTYLSSQDAKIIFAINSNKKLINIALHTFDKDDFGTGYVYRRDFLLEEEQLFQNQSFSRKQHLVKSKNINLPNIFEIISRFNIINNIDTVYVGHSANENSFYHWSYTSSQLKPDEAAAVGKDLAYNNVFVIYPEFKDVNSPFYYNELIHLGLNLTGASLSVGDFLHGFLNSNSLNYDNLTKSGSESGYLCSYDQTTGEIDLANPIDLKTEVPGKLKKKFFRELKKWNKDTIEEIIKFKQKHPSFPILIYIEPSVLDTFMNEKKDQLIMNVDSLNQLYSNNALAKNKSMIIIENSMFQLPDKPVTDLADKTIIFNYSHDSKNKIEKTWGKAILDFTDKEIMAGYEYFLPILEYMFETENSYKVHKEEIKNQVKLKMGLIDSDFDSKKYNQALYLLKKHSKLIETKDYGNKLSKKAEKKLIKFTENPNKYPIEIKHSNGRTVYLIYLDGYFSSNKKVLNLNPSMDLKIIEHKLIPLKKDKDINLIHVNSLKSINRNRNL